VSCLPLEALALLAGARLPGVHGGDSELGSRGSRGEDPFAPDARRGVSGERRVCYSYIGFVTGESERVQGAL
jgi:hypothetical protein